MGFSSVSQNVVYNLLQFNPEKVAVCFFATLNVNTSFFEKHRPIMVKAHMTSGPSDQHKWPNESLGDDFNPFQRYSSRSGINT